MIVGIFLHEGHGLAQVVVGHLLRLRERPQPVHIHVCVSHEVKRIACHIRILLHGRQLRVLLSGDGHTKQGRHRKCQNLLAHNHYVLV